MTMSYNKWSGIGNVGADAEMRITPSGAPVTSFNIAVTEKVKGEPVTQWLRVSAWGTAEKEGLAGVCANYVKKGDPIYVEGPIRMTSYTKDGVEKFNLEVTLREMRLLGTKGEPKEEESPF